MSSKRTSDIAAGPGNIDLTGKVAVVTGGAQGIGAATVEALARHGADVATCDRNADGLRDVAERIRARGRRAVARRLDVRDDDAVAAFLAEARATLGPIDILVNNVGGGYWSPFLDVRPKGQKALIDENFTSVTHVIRHGVPLMAYGGSIINVTSVEAFRAAPGFAIYAAMKAGVEQLTRTLALELSDRRIRVNSVAPDAIPTPGDAELAAAAQGANTAVDGYDEYAASVPLGIGTPEDVAGPIVFLASQMSAFMTGSTLHVDGGTNAAGGWRRNLDGHWRP
ncbi:SDR family oxidoreductase [Rhodococcus sp. IEGM 1366]|uniref:SDR family NAD(P)-dependent oxidoreductase n=1 Tax=Rhodococcus sp. IEGM 1366 TaxID=3082223 RepID=UPI0029545121|nr:SDR family oxidoreductase [Rhodococcus sp. IEGM 1366]MDV8071031.1 SDR family oxidoreductase [Rhodococcus sp. IEGM 1366]